MAVPVPVERKVFVEKHVAKPYTVEVPQPYAVPKPYVINPVQHVVETPVLDKHHTVVHQPAAQVAYAAPVAHVAPFFHAAPFAHAVPEEATSTDVIDLRTPDVPANSGLSQIVSV